MITDQCFSPSLKDRLKSSICCFRHHILQQEEEEEEEENGGAFRKTSPRSPYSWLKSTAQDLEIKERCFVLIGKRGKNRRRYSSADFSYDPMSYALNFEEKNNEVDEVPLHNFMSRLPATPERLPARGKWAETSSVVVWS